MQPKYIGDFSNPFTKYLKSYPYHAKSYQINISKGWNDYKLSISKKLSNDSERQIKRLKKIGNIKFEIAKNIDEARIFTNKMIFKNFFNMPEQVLIISLKIEVIKIFILN